MNKFFDDVAKWDSYVSVQCSDYFLQIGIIELLKTKFQITANTLDENTVPSLFIGDNFSLLRIESQRRMKIINNARLILFFESSTYISKEYFEKEKLKQIGKNISTKDFMKLVEVNLDPNVSIASIPADKTKALSTNERMVLKYIAMGKKQYQISRILALSPKTVSYHKIKAMKKLNIPTNIALYYWLSLGGFEELLSAAVFL